MDYVVTNRHCVENAENGEIFFHIQKNGQHVPKQLYKLEFSASDFIFHPNSAIDIAVLPLQKVLTLLHDSDIKLFYVGIDETAIPTTKAENNYISNLEDIIFVGYPNGIVDDVNYFPIVRRGITATSYMVDFMGTERFLIDASVFGGSSGSPVFIYRNGTYSDNLGNAFIGEKFYFLGIIESVYFKNEFLDIPSDDTTQVSVKQMIDLGSTIKAKKILEAIDSCC